MAVIERAILLVEAISNLVTGLYCVLLFFEDNL